MWLTRAAYHSAVRRVKQNAKIIINERVADAKLQSNARNVWSEIKRIRSSKSINKWSLICSTF